ncbi:Methyltransferase type 11 protein [Rutstroemia sp. NJR-2017a WRK4]|nr:Methyltransferase type 11 protein [Rutstroemia sp. NJR-2017a WRK4]
MATSLKSDVTPLGDSFNTHAATYDRRTGGTTLRIIKHIVPLLADHMPEHPIVLDNACGPGFAAAAIVTAYPNSHVYAADAAPGMISIAAEVVKENGWENKIETAVMNGMDLQYPDEKFDISITNFGIFFFPDPNKGAREIYRTLKHGGRAVVTSWKKMDFIPILHMVQAIIKPGSKPSAPPGMVQWTLKETLESNLRDGGFEDVQVHEREVMWWNKGFHEAAVGLTDNFVFMVGDDWSEEDKGQILPVTEQILKEQVGGLVVESDGMVGCHMSAWVAMAVKA